MLSWNIIPLPKPHPVLLGERLGVGLGPHPALVREGLGADLGLIPFPRPILSWWGGV